MIVLYCTYVLYVYSISVLFFIVRTQTRTYFCHGTVKDKETTDFGALREPRAMQSWNQTRVRFIREQLERGLPRPASTTAHGKGRPGRDSVNATVNAVPRKHAPLPKNVNRLKSMPAGSQNPTGFVSADQMQRWNICVLDAYLSAEQKRQKYSTAVL